MKVPETRTRLLFRWSQMKEEAYRKAYQDHAKQKLANATSLPVEELIKLEERARRLGLKVDSYVNRKKNPEAKTPDAEQRDGRESSGREW